MSSQHWAQLICSRKWVFLSESLAMNMALLLSWVHPEYKALFAYECSVCADWHLTSRQPRGLTAHPRARETAVTHPAA